MEVKHRGSRRRRERTARMQKRQQLQQQQCDASENDEDTPPVRQKRPLARKKRNKEPVFQEDIVDGFAFLCFKTYEDLERTVNKYEKKASEGGDGAPPEDGAATPRAPHHHDHPPVLEESVPQVEKKPKAKKNNNILPKVKKKNFLNKVRNNLKEPCLTNDENSRPGEEILETPRSTSRDQLSDASSRASSERGYMCDSESGDDRGSEPECDLFNSKITDSNFIAKKNNPGHTHSCRSPPVLPPIHPVVVQNGTHHHPEPSTAVAAVTSPAATPLVVGAASPREPRIGSPAVVPPVSCASSPPSGAVPAPSPPPFLQKGAGNGYEFVSDPSPPSPKRLSPAKFLHKRAPPVPSEGGGSSAKPAAINVYDFVSDHSAPSSPNGVIFLSQSSKFPHKPPPAPKDSAAPSLSPPHPHKSALDMSMKACSKPPGAEQPHQPPPQPPQQQPPPAAPVELRVPPRFPPYPTSVPTPVPARDTHSSHSNSSLSSLSQLSGTPAGHKEREGAGSRSNSTSGIVPVASTAAAASVYASASSLAGLVFSKPHCWSGNSSTTNTMSTSVSRSASPPPPRASPALSTGSGGLPLPPTLPPAHHTSPFGGPAPPPLLPVASHHTMFTPGSLTPTLPLDATAGPSPYRADALFPQPSEYKKHPDLLRRELDTRFLASQDHSIPIPPPPYMQNEVQHHGQIHQQASFMAPPPLGAPMVSQQTPPHLTLQSPGFVSLDSCDERDIQALMYCRKNYEKYPKLESSLYGRPSQIGLSGYPSVSSLFAPGGGGASTPFVPPAHLAGLQPKINSVPKNKSMKPGKWCAMHVRIAWEIYNHQQKQKRAEAHKAGIALTSVKPPPPSDHLHATNHLFCSLPRQHELSPFSSSLLTAAATAHPRSFEPSSHHSTFLNPTPAHLGPFARPGYPSFAGPAPSFTGLGPLGIPGPAMLGADLRTAGCLPQDPWAQRTALSFAGGSPWGGLKEEAERDRLQQERKREEERQKRAEQERREKEERERREQERREQERRELERQEQERKEQERKEKERREREERRRELERREMERREQERREQERQKERDREFRLHHHFQKNPGIVMNGEVRDHPQHHHYHHPAAAPPTHHPHQWDRVPQIKYEPVDPSAPRHHHHHHQQPHHHHHPHHAASPYAPVKIKQERKDDEPPRVAPRPPDQRRRPGSSGGGDTDPAASPLWGPLTPSPSDPYRTMAPGRGERFNPSPREPPPSALADLERQLLERERAAKLLQAAAPPPTLPPAGASSFFSPPVSPYLRTKPQAPPPVLNGLPPPPLIPCTFPVAAPPQNHASPMGHPKLGAPPGVLNLHEGAPTYRREVNGHPAELEAHLRL